MSSKDLTELSPRILKEYINAYHISAKSAIEKSDLVKIIFNARPISNENECHYRFNRNNPNTEPSKRRNNQPWQKQWQQQQQQSYQQRYAQQQQQQQSQRQTPPQSQPTRQPPPQTQPQGQHAKPTMSKSTPTSTTDNLSLHDMIKSNIDPSSLSVRTLKSILKANFVQQSHVIEKAELVRLVQRLLDQQKQEMSSSSSSDDSLCRVCCDAQQNCVFLDCGHMVTCMDCAKKVSKLGMINKWLICV